MRGAEVILKGNMMKKAVCAAALLAIGTARAESLDNLNLEYHGAGWVQLGRVEASYAKDGTANDYDRNWLGNAGGVISTSSKIDEHWDGSFGIGTIMVQLARGSIGQAEKWYTFWVPFIGEARLSYSTPGYAEKSGFRFNFGLQGYNYSPDAKNLGLYLMKGYVYPGALSSGFGNLFGAVMKSTFGTFNNDLIVNMETEDKPLYDISIADVATMDLPGGIQIGAGVNLYRVIPANERSTVHDFDCKDTDLGPYALQGQVGDEPCYIVLVDSAGKHIDSVAGGLGGTKLMGRFRVDPKAWFGGSESLGKDDLVIYGEAALIGVKSYKSKYDIIGRRIPVMIGLNLPGFKLFNWSVEGEFYANKQSGDNLGARNGSWVASQGSINPARDDWKWSVNASVPLLGNMALAAQVANDHMRIGGNHDTDVGKEATRTGADWYWTSKLAYFF